MKGRNMNERTADQDVQQDQGDVLYTRDPATGEFIPIDGPLQETTAWKYPTQKELIDKASQADDPNAAKSRGQLVAGDGTVDLSKRGIPPVQQTDNGAKPDMIADVIQRQIKTMDTHRMQVATDLLNATNYAVQVQANRTEWTVRDWMAFIIALRSLDQIGLEAIEKNDTDRLARDVEESLSGQAKK